MKYLFYLILVATAGCTYSDSGMSYNVEGYAPIYSTQQLASEITSGATRPTIQPGKIYAYGNYLFQVEQNEGIHVIDNTNPQQAHKVSFISIPGCSELAIKSGYLYTNNIDDLVVLDLSNISNPQVVQRLDGAFPQISQDYPQVSNGYFECPDPSKGIVVGWQLKLLTDAKCRR